MGYGEKRGDYHRARYKIQDGKPYGTVKDDDGNTIRFRTKREAEQAADAAEVAVRAGTYVDRSAIPTFAEYVNQWWAGQELAPSTMQNYPSHIQGHLLPTFGDMLITSITRADVEAWQKNQRADYAQSSVTTYRSVLHLILQDAVEDVPAMGANPAAQRRGRGRRAGRSKGRGPEKVVTDPLGALLVAERAAILSGRDDEFVETVTTTYTGIRWGEAVGLDRAYVRPSSIQIEEQLYELDDGTMVRCPPKDDSYRTIDTPRFLSALLTDHLRRTSPSACPCHGMRTVFRAAGLRQELRVPRARIAERAGVSAATVSRVQNRPEMTSQATRDRVRSAMAELGVVEDVGTDQLVPHWSRDDHRHRIFAPAASGWYPTKGAGHAAHPVCVVAGEQWPGAVVRGRWSGTQATACWVPVAAGLTNHGLRHCHATWLEDLGAPKVLIDERMGHMDGSVSARYKHVTQGMRDRTMAGLTDMWEQSLTARATLTPRSPVAVLDRLLQEHTSRHLLSQNSPQRVISQTLRRMGTTADLHISNWVA
ncbi:LacI family DNA-binding transcriptional regulator [Streptomyces sp. NPDC057136]|uniref:LacI family DNA-binding transcriptional regulator n=1 Tax=Streptomyces sp. NPDC057136 TaxID=3346029 RepID=UPI00362B77CE